MLPSLFRSLLRKVQGDLAFTTPASRKEAKQGNDAHDAPDAEKSSTYGPLVEAQDSSTTPEQLRQIYQAHRTSSPTVWRATPKGKERAGRVRAAIAAHPNTPLDILAELVPENPDAFVANPIAPLIPLEAPDFLANVPADGLLRLLRRADTPGLLATLMTAHPAGSVAEAARLHISQAGEAEPGQWEAEIQAHIRALPLGAPAQLLELWELGVAPEWVGETLGGSFQRDLRQGALLSPLASVSPRFQRLREAALRASGCEDLSRINPVFDRDLEPVTLALLAEAGPWLRQLAARHPNTAPDLLALLAVADREWMVRAYAARNPFTPVGALRRLVDDSNEALRIAVGRNPAMPPELLAALARDPSPRVRAMAARHPALPPEQIPTLVGDTDAVVRIAALRHPAAPAELITKARTEDPSERVRRALQTPEERSASEESGLSAVPVSSVPPPPGKADDKDKQIAVARNRRTPAALLTGMAQGADQNVATALAGNPATPPAVLRQLFRTWNSAGQRVFYGYRLGRALAGNPQVPLDVLEELVKHSDPVVRYTIAANPKATEQILRTLAGDTASKVRRCARRVAHRRFQNVHTDFACRSQALPAALKEAIGGGESNLLRFLALAHSQTPGLNLKTLSEGNAWQDRLAIALSARTPQALRTQLAEDGCRPVRAAARARLAGGPPINLIDPEPEKR